MRYIIVLLSVVMSILLLAPYFGVDPLGHIFYSNSDLEIVPPRSFGATSASSSRRERNLENEEAVASSQTPQTNTGLAEIEDLLEER